MQKRLCLIDHWLGKTNQAHWAFKRSVAWKTYYCCRRQTDMAWRYPDDDPLRRMRSHNVALTVGLSMQRHHQHEIPASTETPGGQVTNAAVALMCAWSCVFHLWSGLGLPFFLMLFAVVSLKWSRPTVTFVTCSGGRVTLGATKSQIWQIVNHQSPVLSFGSASDHDQMFFSMEFQTVYQSFELFISI